MDSIYQLFPSLTLDIVTLVDKQGNVHSINSRMQKILGWEESEIKGKPFSTFFHPDDFATGMKILGTIFSDPTAPKGMDARCLHKDGTWKWVRWMGQSHKDSPYLLAVGKDLTFEKEAGSAVQVQKDLYEQIFNAMEEFVLVKGAKSKLLWANKAFCDYYGMTNEQLQGIIDAPFAEPDYTQQYVKDDAYVFEKGKVLHIPNEPVKRHDGEIRKFYTIKSPLFSSDGKVVMTVGISRDITQQLAAEKAAVEHIAKSEASARLASLGEMAAGVAHEINNPLAVILGRGQIILSKVRSGRIKLEEIAEPLEKVLGMAKRIEKIVKGMRSFSRDGSQDPFSKVNLNDIVSATLDLVHEKLHHKGVRLDVKVPATPTIVYAKEVQIGQVLSNLVINAIDAIEPLEAKWITLEVKAASYKVELSITDSGSGIPKEVQAKMMEPFFTTKSVGKGTGLGLSISRSIMSEHEGELIYDGKCKNTRFILQFPVAMSDVKAKNLKKVA